MKTKIKYPLVILSIFGILMAVPSCKKDDKTKPADTNSTGTNNGSNTTNAGTNGTNTNNTNTNTTGNPNSNGSNTNIVTGTLMFHLHSFIDAVEVDGYNIVYTTEAGRNISLSLAQLYLSDIQLEKLDGSFYDITDQKILKVLEGESFLAGNVPPGNYKSVRFKVGLPPSTNSLSPGSSPDSLILNRPEMWFSNTAQPNGYVFLNVQGAIDTSADMSGKMCPFVYKIGTNANYKQVIMPAQNFTILPNQVEFVHMYVDYNVLFSGITLDNFHLNVSTVAENTSATVNQIVNNIPYMFRYE